MAKLWTSAPDERLGGTPRAARDEVIEGEPATALDAEMLDLVQRFEKGYAELEPAAEEHQHRAAAGDELFPDFPDVFADAPPARPPVAESARVVPISRREFEAPAAAAAAPSPASSREPAAEVDLDEAMAILRASELRAPGSSQPDADDREEAASPKPASRGPAEVGSRRRRKAVEAREPQAAARAPERVVPEIDWSTRSKGTRTVAAIASVAALAVGIAGGYLLARAPGKAPSAVIESSKEGGTQLKLERNLPQSAPAT